MAGFQKLDALLILGLLLTESTKSVNEVLGICVAPQLIRLRTLKQAADDLWNIFSAVVNPELLQHHRFSVRTI